MTNVRRGSRSAYLLLLSSLAVLCSCKDASDVTRTEDAGQGPIDEGADVDESVRSEAGPPGGERCTDPAEVIALSEDGDTAVDEGGCPCTEVAEMRCYGGEPAQLDVGRCRSGRLACVDRLVMACRGQVLPAERDDCNEVDDDCDGTVDEDCAGTAVCAPDYVGRVARSIRLQGDFYVPEGSNNPPMVVGSAWSLVRAPPGATAVFSRVDGSVTGLTADAPGAYEVRYRATDSRQRETECHSIVTVTDGALLEVELRWRTVSRAVGPAGFDFDLHLLRSPPGRWSFDDEAPRDASDCFWANGRACLSWAQGCSGCDVDEDDCRATLDEALENPDIGRPGGCAWADGWANGEEDPWLDIDDHDDTGREVMHIDVPEPMTYRVGVAIPAYVEPAYVLGVPTIEVRCAGRTTWISRPQPQFERRNDIARFWEVADIRWTPHIGCEVSPLAPPRCWPLCSQDDARRGICEAAAPPCPSAVE